MTLLKKHEDILLMLDSLFSDEKERWDDFFGSLKEDHPLATELPDESLVSFIEKGSLKSGRALEIGCGNGRNSLYLAAKGFQVDGMDLSSTAILKAREIAGKRSLDIQYEEISFFDFSPETKYDFIYDSGLLHHVFPHRRPQYLEQVSKLLNSGGIFGVVAFNEKMGTHATDKEIIENRSLKGGISYPEDKLKDIFEDQLELLEYKPLRNCNKEDELFGYDFLSCSFWKKLT